jgi:hypothetical protein
MTMGTRSLTVVKRNWEQGEFEPIATIYRHYDGYPSVQGKLIADFLDGLTLVNGVSGDTPKRHANGPGRLAAQLVCAMADEGVEPSLERHGVVSGQEYEYHLLCHFGFDGGTVEVVVFDGPMTAFGCGGDECTNEIFRGTPEAFSEWVDRWTHGSGDE